MVVDTKTEMYIYEIHKQSQQRQRSCERVAKSPAPKHTSQPLTFGSPGVVAALATAVGGVAGGEDELCVQSLGSLRRG